MAKKTRSTLKERFEKERAELERLENQKSALETRITNCAAMVDKLQAELLLQTYKTFEETLKNKGLSITDVETAVTKGALDNFKKPAEPTNDGKPTAPAMNTDNARSDTPRSELTVHRENNTHREDNYEKAV